MRAFGIYFSPTEAMMDAASRLAEKSAKIAKEKATNAAYMALGIALSSVFIGPVIGLYTLDRLITRSR